MKHWHKLFRGGGCLSPGNSQGQFQWDPEQLSSVEDVLVLCRGVGLDDF